MFVFLFYSLFFFFTSCFREICFVQSSVGFFFFFKLGGNKGAEKDPSEDAGSVHYEFKVSRRERGVGGWGQGRGRVRIEEKNSTLGSIFHHWRPTGYQDGACLLSPRLGPPRSSAEHKRSLPECPAKTNI